MRLQAAMLCVMVCVAGAHEPQVSTAELWSQTDPVVGEVINIGEQGIDFRVREQVIHIQIPWYDLRDLRGQREGFDSFEQVAEDAWRAHARLARGDFAGAEEHYVRLEDEYLWKIGMQSADVSLGLIRCRLDREDRVGAVMPSLSWLGAGEAVNGLDLVGGVRYDAKYNLLTDLPPVFGPRDRTSIPGVLPDMISADDRRRILAGYFELAHGLQLHRLDKSREILDELNRLIRDQEGRDPGLELFKDMVVVQAHPDVENRRAARMALERRVRSEKGTWVEVWARLGIGVSLLVEQDTESNERGVIQLIHIVVRLENVSRPLAVLASQIADDYFIRTNRSQWGAELMLEARSAWDSGSDESKSMEHASHE